jgi:hypothetical protein
MVAELIVETLMVLWAPPERMLSSTWRRFKHRSAPARALGVLLCTLIIVVSLAVFAGILVLLIGGPIWLISELI